MTSSDGLAGLSSALIADSCDRCGLLPRQIRSLVPGLTAIGPAFPFEFDPGDNLAVHLAVAAAPRGSVLVGACHAPAEVGVFGAILTTAAQGAGLVGLVTDAFVRDRAALRAAGFPVFASGCAPRKATKDSPGRIAVKVMFGAQVVAPDDLVCADDDGIVIVPRADIAAVLARAASVREREETVISRVMAGETTLRALEIDPGNYA